jgi:Putative Flp pilus-assembly TadE/G-like
LLKLHKRGRREGGQTLILVIVALPLFFALMALVVDGGNILVHKRNIQVAADAAALAIAQNVDHTTNTCGTYNGQTGDAACNTLAAEYSSRNGVNSSLHKCNDPDPTHPTDTNCWAYPYIDTSGHMYNDQVEVRLHAPVSTFFVGAADALLHGGVTASFSVSARAVASTNQVIGVTTIPGQTFTGSTTTIPGETHTTTDPGITLGGSGVAFTMSPRCDAITYQGDGSGTRVLGAFGTNGGITFTGNKPKKLTSLAFNQTGCPNNPASPPSGTNLYPPPPQCTAVAWGDGSDSNNYCVQTLFNLNQNGGWPQNWPITPPTVPQPQNGAYDPATYPSRCSNVTSKAKNGVVSVDVGDPVAWPTGIYCVTGNTSFFIQGTEPATSDGHTFFAGVGSGGNGQIEVAANGNTLKDYWPASKCGPRPLPTDPRKGCVAGYDPYTLFYATSQGNSAGMCTNNAICLHGGGNNLTGDLFATKPDVFPPPPGATGGGVNMEGGALAAGSGFIESWNLYVAGNNGTYTGTGFGIVIPGATHTTTDASTTIIVTGSTGAATTVGTTLGTTLALTQ